MAENYGKADMTLYVYDTGTEEFTAEPPTDSRYVCYHPYAPGKERAMMHVCDCGRNAQCPVCGYGWGSWPCDCDGIMVQREPGWVPRG